jgi:integrase
MASRKRGSVQQRGKSISVVIDAGEAPWRRCPTPRCSGSVFTDRTGAMTCKRCEAPLEPPVLHRKRAWQSGFKNVTEAKRALTVALGEVDQGSFTEPSRLTVREFIEKTWLPGLEVSDLRPSTVNVYRRSATHYVLPGLGRLRLRDLTPMHLKKWLDGLKRAGVGLRTVELAGVTAHRLLESAVDLKLLGQNPANNKEVRKARPKAPAPAPEIWTAEQTRAFLESQRNDRLFPLWRLAATTGMRRGELAGLKWKAVNLDAGELTISETRVVVEYEVVTSKPKTVAGARTIHLDPATVAVLKQHRARQAEEMLAFGKHRTKDSLVFVREDGVPFHPEYLTRTFEARAKAAGLPPIRLHALRHSYATAALVSGEAMKVISERLGHASVVITNDLYSHVAAATDAAAADRVAAAIDGA